MASGGRLACPGGSIRRRRLGVRSSGISNVTLALNLVLSSRCKLTSVFYAIPSPSGSCASAAWPHRLKTLTGKTDIRVTLAKVPVRNRAGPNMIMMHHSVWIVHFRLGVQLRNSAGSLALDRNSDSEIYVCSKAQGISTGTSEFRQPSITVMKCGHFLPTLSESEVS